MLELNGISKTFRPGGQEEVRALRKVDLTVEEGAFVVLVGGNGSGKSTLLNVIAGAVPVDEGTIRIGGIDVTGVRENRRARDIGHVFQNPSLGTAPGLTIEENLALAARRGMTRGIGFAITRSFRNEIRERLSAFRLGLEDRLKTPVGRLSGGQRQALTLLMAIWNRPRLLLLDEHTSALDPKNAEMVIRLSREIIQRNRVTALMVTHSMEQGATLGDRLIMLYRGRIEHDFVGAEKERLRAEELHFHFEELRKEEQLNENAAAMLRRLYV